MKTLLKEITLVTPVLAANVFNPELESAPTTTCADDTYYIRDFKILGKTTNSYVANSYFHHACCEDETCGAKVQTTWRKYTELQWNTDQHYHPVAGPNQPFEELVVAEETGTIAHDTSDLEGDLYNLTLPVGRYPWAHGMY